MFGEQLVEGRSLLPEFQVLQSLQYALIVGLCCTLESVNTLSFVAEDVLGTTAFELSFALPAIVPFGGDMLRFAVSVLPGAIDILPAFFEKCPHFFLGSGPCLRRLLAFPPEVVAISLGLFFCPRLGLHHLLVLLAKIVVLRFPVANGIFQIRRRAGSGLLARLKLALVLCLLVDFKMGLQSRSSGTS